MHNHNTIEDYKKRIIRVIDYMYDHLDDDLASEKLAEVACFSPYHWHRIYHAMTGETAVQTVRRLRLHRAAGELQNSSRPIAKIAVRAGYNSVEAFNRAFAKAFKLPPAAFRQSRQELYPKCSYAEEIHDMYNVEIREISVFSIAAIRHQGSYMESGKSFEKLLVWAGPRGLLQNGVRMVGVYYDDPAQTPEEDLRSDTGIIVNPDCEVEAPVHLLNIQSGTYAVLLHKGPYSDLAQAYQWLFGQWLPNSGREVANRHSFEAYLNNPKDTPPADLLTELCLPLKVE